MKLRAAAVVALATVTLATGTAHAGSDTYLVQPGETLTCAGARFSERNIVKSRAPSQLVQIIAAEVKKFCEPKIDAAGQAITPPAGPPANWRKQQIALINATRAKRDVPGVQACTRLNNVAQKTVPIVMETWIRSTGHYRNLMERRFTDVGLGVAKAENGRLYWVQNFGAGGSCR